MHQLAYILQLLPPTVCADRNPRHLSQRAVFAGVYFTKQDGAFLAVLCLTGMRTTLSEWHSKSELYVRHVFC